MALTLRVVLNLSSGSGERLSGLINYVCCGCESGEQKHVCYIVASPWCPVTSEPFLSVLFQSFKNVIKLNKGEVFIKYSIHVNIEIA